MSRACRAHRQSAKLICHAGKQPEDDDVDLRVRRRLRELRTQRGLTLEEVATRAEHRRVDAEPAGIRQAPPGAGSPAPARRGAVGEHRRTAARARGRGPTGTRQLAHPPRHHLLAADPAGPGRWPARVQDSGQRTAPHTADELPVHDGQDWMYVLSGRLRLILGDRDFTIKPGEAVEFSTWTPHWFGAVDGPVEAHRDLRAARRTPTPARPDADVTDRPSGSPAAPTRRRRGRTRRSTATPGRDAAGTGCVGPASSASRSMVLIGVTWDTTSTVASPYSAMIRSRARRTRCATVSKLSPPGGATAVSRSHRRVQLGIALARLRRTSAPPSRRSPSRSGPRRR